MAQGGHGARDGGRTRANLLRRAAMIAHKDLNDVEQAFTWLGDALVAHVDPLTLDMLESLGMDCGDPRRAEAALTHALSEVFDGPLVKQLLGRRAKIRRDQLIEPVNAAADLKKLHDLSPTDQSVMDELAGLLMELSDYKSLVQLYEDQILRGKDMNARAELARKVARVWEEQLADGREAADAWRRVLRMKAGDAEATQGLERSKSGALKKPEGDPKFVYAPPKLVSDQPVPAPVRTATSRAPSVAPKATDAPKPEATRRPSAAASPAETTSTGTSPTTELQPRAPISSRPRSAPPPLPSQSPSIAGSGSVGGMLGRDPSLENEIDASLDALEAPSFERTGEGVSSALPSTQDSPSRQKNRPADVDFTSDPNDVTSSGQVVPTTLRDSMRSSGGSGATDQPPPMTVPGGPNVDTEDGGTPLAHEEIGSGELIDIEDTGANMRLETTHASAGGHEDEIVIADDLAEEIGEHGAPKQTQVDPNEEEEHTDAGVSVPPFRHERR
jgi:hypothetical protein